MPSTEACARVIRALFEEFGATRIIAEIDTRNQASIGLAERLGFRRTGFKPAADHFKAAPSDEYRYELESGA